MIFDLDTDRIRHRPGIKWGRHGPDVLAAWVADMDVELPDVILDAVNERLRSGGLGYDFYDEPVPVIDCFVRRMRDRFEWEIEPSEIIRLQDVVQGLQLAIDQLSSPGDGIVVQTPVYPPFLSSIEGTSRRVISNPMINTDEGWRIDFDQLESVFADPKTTLLILCNPHNPLGRVFTLAELEAMNVLAERHDITVIADEIHFDLLYSPHQHVPFAGLNASAASRTVTITAATKSFNMAGFRLAFLHTHSAELRARLDQVPPRILGGANILGQVATVAGWDHGQGWLDELVAGLDHNRHLLAELLNQHLPGVVYRPPEATYLAWLDCRALSLETEPFDAFMSGGVALNDGLGFGAGGQGHVRLNFATSPQMLEMIVTRMAAAVS
ncbi:MAG: MalY/PatB family protein [Acidimicrobiales bacterium]|jgi:cystathionine beta-lyase